MEDMDPGLISRLNELWRPIYPYLAQWITQWCPTKPYWILELGPFSGGISNLLSGLSKNVRTVCLMPQHGVAQGMRDQFESNVQALVGSLERLPFMASFDVVLFRGAFFFLTLEIIREGYRVLKPGAYALLGGGYGPLTPSKEIAKIAEESKRLNYQLGKKWISRKELAEMVKDAEMERYSEILEEGGLWLLLKKGFL
jgi:SAM-dependent methyltransferase